MRATRVPYLEPIVGAAWWTVGAAALDGGFGTVVLAVGLGVMGMLVFSLRSRIGGGEPLPLGRLSWGELAVPVAAAIVGVALLMLSSQLDERSLLALGGALMVLGAAGALLALDSSGQLYPQGVVGLVAGGLFWLTSAHRTGLLADLRHRSHR
jgi:hypothetical protein